MLSVLAACTATLPGSRTGGGAETVQREKRPPPERALLSHEQAVALMNAARWAEAEAELEALVARYDDFPGPHVNLAIIYAREGRAEAAFAALDAALAIDPAFAPANNQLGLMLRKAGRFDEAEAAYRRALDGQPDYLLARRNLAILLDIYLRRPVEALEQYRRLQAALAEPDERVERWIVDLERRVGAEVARVAQDESQ